MKMFYVAYGEVYRINDNKEARLLTRDCQIRVIHTLNGKIVAKVAIRPDVNGNVYDGTKSMVKIGTMLKKKVCCRTVYPDNHYYCSYCGHSLSL